MCWWEQRGSGISYSKEIKPEEMTMEQMISDTISVTKYLCKRVGKDKIYLMGHSWGTFLGMHTVQLYPEFYHAYIGIGQVVQQEKSEHLAYNYMLEEFQRIGDQKMVHQLEKCPIDAGGEINAKYLQVRSLAMNKLGIGVMRSMTSMFDSVKLVFGCEYYTLREKFKYPIGLSFSNKYLWNHVLHSNLYETMPELRLPVYIFQGKYDYQVSYAIAKDYAAVLMAPLKGFYTFENSAHSPCFEKPEKMCDILRTDVLQMQVSLADERAIL